MNVIAKSGSLPAHTLRVGYASGKATGHFGEILQGRFQLGSTLPSRGLVTLPTNDLYILCKVEVIEGFGRIISPQGKTKSIAAAKGYLSDKKIDYTNFDISLTFSGNIPEGVGLGSSTADITATFRALDQICETETPPLRFAQLAVEAEQASDPTMLSENAILFAQRNGNIIEDFGTPLPPMKILGINTQKDTIFDTVNTPAPDYSKTELETFSRLLKQLRTAIFRQDASQIGSIATDSALINQRHFPKPYIDLLLKIAAVTDGTGVAVSHSGTMAGVLYSSSTFISGEKLHLAREYLARANIHEILEINVGP